MKGTITSTLADTHGRSRLLRANANALGIAKRRLARLMLRRKDLDYGSIWKFMGRRVLRHLRG
jgi:hypothetical protein